MAQKETEVVKKRIESLKKHIRKKSMLDKLTTIIEYEVMNLNISPEMIDVITNGRGNLLRKIQTEEFEVPEDWFNMPLTSDALVQNLRSLNIKKFTYFVGEYKKRNPGNAYTDYGQLFIELYRDRYEDDFQAIERDYEKFANDELELMLNYSVNGQEIDLLLRSPDTEEERIEAEDVFDRQKKFLTAILKNLSKTGCLKDLVFSENKNIKQMNKFLSDSNKIATITEDDIYNQITNLNFETEEDRVKLVVFARTYANKLAHNYDDYIMMNIEPYSKLPKNDDNRISTILEAYNKLFLIMRDYNKAIRANRANLIDVPSFSEFFKDVLESQKHNDGYEFGEIEKRNGEGIQNIAKTIRGFLTDAQNNFENPEQLFIEITKKMEFAERLFEIKNRYTYILAERFSENSPYFMENFLPEDDDGVVDVYMDGYMQAFGGHYKPYEALAEDYTVQSLPRVPKVVGISFFESNDGQAFNTFIPLNKLTDAQRADFARLWETIAAVENGTVDDNKEYFMLEEVKRLYSVKKTADSIGAMHDEFERRKTDMILYQDEVTKKRKKVKSLGSKVSKEKDKNEKETLNGQMRQLQKEMSDLEKAWKAIEKINGAEKIKLDELGIIDSSKATEEEYKLNSAIKRIKGKIKSFKGEEKFFDVLKLRTALAIGLDFYKEKYAQERVQVDCDKKLNPEQLEMAKICLEYIKAGFDINLLSKGGILEIKDPVVIDYCRRHSLDPDEERTQDVTEHDEAEQGNR
ncbi:MAG: hypothetical protein IJW20_03670 [Clostridia bacterium]|nr:hypothetical protein [Clostridia bacterium]